MSKARCLLLGAATLSCAGAFAPASPAGLASSSPARNLLTPVGYDSKKYEKRSSYQHATEFYHKEINAYRPWEGASTPSEEESEKCRVQLREIVDKGTWGSIDLEPYDRIANDSRLLVAA